VSNEKYHISSSQDSEAHDIGVIEAEVSIEGLAVGGRGVGRVGGRVWFVPGAVPGDQVIARSSRVKERFVEAELKRRIVSSPDRRDPPCRLQPECGGCPWMVLDETMQRRHKHEILTDTLRRLGGFKGLQPEPMVFADASFAYRNKVEFRIRVGPKAPTLIGFQRPVAGDGLVDVDLCPLQHPEANQVLATVREWWNRPERSGDEAGSHRLTLRRSWSTGEMLVAVGQVGGSLPAIDGLAELLMQRHPDVVGVVGLMAADGPRGRIRMRKIAGRNWIEEKLGEYRFRLPAVTFSQVNPELGGRLIRAVVDASDVRPGMRVLDLYGGTGAYGLHLAGRGCLVAVCDADASAIRCGRDAARRARVSGIRFVHSDVLRFLRGGESAADLVVANPPRTGLGRGVARQIVASGCRRVVLVSCDPASLARDLRSLADQGFALDRVIPFDLFPQTAHVEALAVMSR
jgi:23S rRNA (uracil1939-C5)-methyltransferase